MKMNSKMLWAPLVLLAMTTSAASADTIKGKVTDDSGKPVRGAVVKATNTADPNNKATVVYSQKDGQYSIDVPAGTYQVQAEAYGFARNKSTKDTAQKGNVDLALMAKWDTESLTGSDVISLVPNDQEGKLIKSLCVQCHTLEMPLRHRGYTAAEWKSFIPRMFGGKGGPRFTPTQLDALSKALEKDFGPNSQFSPDAPPIPRAKVNHPAMGDEALTATITEWDIPESFHNGKPHSINIDSRSNVAYFTGGGKTSTFDAKTEKFSQYDTKGGHTPAIEPDGRVFVTLEAGEGRNDAGMKLAMIDPEANRVDFFRYDKGRPHTPIISKDGKVWISGRPGVVSFDPATKEFKHYDFETTPTDPEYSALTWQTPPGEAPPPQTEFTYHLAEDSKGNIWGGSYQVGEIIKIDPKTGQSKTYWPPNLLMVRGVAIDKNDNLYFAAHYDNKLLKMDTKTGKFTTYQPPSPGSTPYGVSYDKKNGYIWMADMAAYTLTRFDPKTEKFVEYRLPGNGALPGNPGPARFIDVADDGKVWFTDYWNGKVGVLDPNGASKQVASR